MSVIVIPRARDGPALVAVRVYVITEPTVGLPVAVLVMTMSASPTTVTGARPIASPGTGSNTSDVATAVLVAVPSAASGLTAAVTVIVAWAPTGSAPRSHTTPPINVHAPRLDTAAVAVNPGGGVSVTFVPVASDGPALVTTIVYRTVPPATTVVGSAALVSCRLASGCPTGTTAVSVARVGLGSGVVDVADAVFVNDVPVKSALETTVTLTVNVSPAARPGSWQRVGDGRTSRGWSVSAR